MHFSDILGQQIVVAQIKHILSSNSVSNAYLFTGAEGLGKKTLSNLFAKAILCRSESENPCDVCASCKEYESGNHPDLKVIKPLKSTIGIEEIRSVQKELSFKPYQSDKKVVIIEDAHLMTFQAQNAILKSLEEPPAFVVFVLLSQRLQGLLPTVISRLRIFRMNRIAKSDVASLVIRKTDTDPEKAALYAALAEGNPGKGISLAVSSDFTVQRERASDFLKSLVYGNFELNDFSSFVKDSRSSVETALNILAAWFRDCLILRETGDNDLIINADMIELLRVYSQVLNSEDLIYIIKMLEEAQRMIKGNTNIQLVVDNVLFEILGRLKDGSNRSQI